MKRISANIASIPNRKESLDKTIKSLYQQVDVINVCLNSYCKDPFINDPKINTIIADNSLGDAGKFLFQEDFNGYYFTCDDDIIYPCTYVKDTIKEIDDFGLVTYNGKIFNKLPIKSFYRDKAKKYRYARSEQDTLKVQVGGTGVMAFDTEFFNIPIYEFKKKNMADIWLACYAKKHGYSIWHIAHKEGYLVSQKTDDSIYDSEQKNDTYQTEIFNIGFK